MTAVAPTKTELPTEERRIIEAFAKFGEKTKVAIAKPNRIKITANREN